jgi:hypothetical protein
MLGVNFGAEPCPQGGIVDGVAMVVGYTDDWCRVDAEVSSESDSEV